jgi:hypothetical protein
VSGLRLVDNECRHIENEREVKSNGLKRKRGDEILR